MPLRKRIGIMGVGCWSALQDSNLLSLRYATQRDTSYTIGTISRFHGLSVALVESCQRFDFCKPMLI